MYTFLNRRGEMMEVWTDRGLTVFSLEKVNGVVINLELGFGVSFSSSRLSKCIGCIKRGSARLLLMCDETGTT